MYENTQNDVKTHQDHQIHIENIKKATKWIQNIPKCKMLAKT